MAVGDDPLGRFFDKRVDDTVLYTGTVVYDQGAQTDLPILHWFMDPDDYQAALGMLQVLMAGDATPMARVPWLEPGLARSGITGGRGRGSSGSGSKSE